MTTIVTKRLRLNLLDEKSLPQICEWLNDPDVVRYSEQRHKKHDYETQYEYFWSGPEQYRGIHTSDAFIGTIAAHIDENNSVANVGILIGEKKEWGKGYGTEAWQAFCDHLLGHGVRKIEAGAMACNFGMINIFRKTKMHLEGWRDEHFQLGDELVHLTQWARFI